MLIPQSFSEQLMYSTVKLSSGSRSATGFFYELNTPKKTIVVISNRHFAEQVDSLDKLDFTKSTISQNVNFNVHLNNGSNYNINEDVDWVLHPSQDLAFFNLTAVLSKYPLPSKVEFFILRVSPTTIPSQQQLENLSVLENVVMVGYPNGLYDEVNNYPVFRTGKTASHPAVDYNGEKKALLDVSCVPGSSGSPVFILDEGWVKHKNGALSQGNRFYFLGIENSMPTRYSKSLLEEKILPNGDKQYVRLANYLVEDDIKLGYYIKSSEISGFNAQIQDLGL